MKQENFLLLWSELKEERERESLGEGRWWKKLVVLLEVWKGKNCARLGWGGFLFSSFLSSTVRKQSERVENRDEPVLIYSNIAVLEQREREGEWKWII